MSRLGHARLGQARLAIALAAALIAETGPAAVVRAADDPSNIPGVPLLASVVSGPLGGPIYDVVYRLEVPAGAVIVAGLSGSAGTDFDLYLFDGSATTVQSTAGLLASSTGPTSSENVSWPTRIGGTFYIDLNGATNVEGTYTLSVQVVADPTPPQVALSVQGGGTAVDSTSITLQVAAFDDLSGVSTMSFSADGLNWTDWEPYALLKAWTLIPPDGRKTIYVRVENGVGLISMAASVSVTLDTVPPTVVSRSPAPDSIVTLLRPTIRVGFSEPIAPATWTSFGLVVQATDGSILAGSYAYDAATQTGSFTPATDLTPGKTYIVTVGQVSDLAGNVASGIGSWTLKAMIATSASLTASPALLVYGGRATLAGRISVPTGQGATLEVRRGDATTFTSVAGVAPLIGAFSFSLAPSGNGWYRVVYPGTESVMAATSATVRILVRRAISILGTGTGTVRSATAGRVVSIVAQNAPASGGGAVSFAAYRWNATTGSWALYRTFVRLVDPTGRATLRWTPSAGRWAWRALIGPSQLYANNQTGLYRWLVR